MYQAIGLPASLHNETDVGSINYFETIRNITYSRSDVHYKLHD